MTECPVALEYGFAECSLLNLCLGALFDGLAFDDFCVCIPAFSISAISFKCFER